MNKFFYEISFKMNNPISFPMYVPSAIKPIPCINPVVNLRRLLLSLSKYACVSPSIIVGKSNTIDTNGLRNHKPKVKNGKVK